MTVIVNYGVGNLSSILNILNKSGGKNISISNNRDYLNEANKLILPGVGNFDFGMQQLRKSGMLELLNKRVLEDKIPILGICLGAQLLTKGSEEGSEPGLGWIDAQTVKFDQSKLDDKLKVPHMGWSDVQLKKPSNLFQNMPKDPRFYFVHSYHIQCNNPEDELLSTHYGYEITAAVEHENIMGVQFHPEKSHKFGMQLLSNFIHNY